MSLLTPSKPCSRVALRPRFASPLPATGYVRLKQIVGDQKARPPVPAIIPIGASSWWAGVKSGRYPKPLKLGPKTTVWRVEDIIALLEQEELA